VHKRHFKKRLIAKRRTRREVILVSADERYMPEGDCLFYERVKSAPLADKSVMNALTYVEG